MAGHMITAGIVAAAFTVAALPAAGQDETFPQYRDHLTIEEASHFYDLYVSGVQNLRSHMSEHGTQLPALTEGQCYTLVNSANLTAIANTLYEHKLDFFAPMIRDSDGRVLDDEGEEFETHNRRTDTDNKVSTHFDTMADLRSAYGAAVIFLDYVSVGCYHNLDRADAAQERLNNMLERDYLQQGMAKLRPAVERHEQMQKAPAPL